MKMNWKSNGIAKLVSATGRSGKKVFPVKGGKSKW
jgi:hypothetical protein